MFPKVKITIDDDVLKELQKTLGNLPKAFTQRFNRRTAGVRAELLRELQQEPGLPTHPIEWKSEAQRRYFWAAIAPQYLDGEGHYTGYPRSHKLSQAWRVTYTSFDRGAVIAASNDDPARPYVEGDWQQPFHVNTGWLYEEEVFRKYRELFTDIAIDTWAAWSE